MNDKLWQMLKEILMAEYGVDIDEAVFVPANAGKTTLRPMLCFDLLSFSWNLTE